MKKVGIRLFCTLSFVLCFALAGCGNKLNENVIEIDVGGYYLEYAGNVQLAKVSLKADDLSEIVDLYQEVGDNVGYRDSLLIAQRYSGGLGINSFAQENLDVLEDHELVLSNINKKQILLKKDGKTENAVLVEYEIVEGFVEEIPTLYISQLFIPVGQNVLLVSYITENSSSRNSASNAFKNIK